MSYQQDIFSLISSIVGQNNNIVLPIQIIDFAGDYHTAALLSQLIYWQGRQKDPDRWIYKTYDQWQVELRLSKYQTSRAAQTLTKMGILETKVARVKLDNGMFGDKAVHYRLKQDEFAEKFVKHLSMLDSEVSLLSKVEDLHYPKASNLTSLSINTEITNKNYDNLPVLPSPDPAPVQKPEKKLSSSFSESQLITILAGFMTLVPQAFQKPTVEKVIEKGLKAHTEDYIRLAILYTIANSNGGTSQKFKSFLGQCIDKHWHNGFDPDSAQVDAKARAEAYLASRRGMPDDILKSAAQSGCQVSAQVLRERGITI